MANPRRTMTVPGRSTAFLLVIVAVAGAGTMVVELSAVRLLAPWFGASTTVWTNVIGVILLALALGYALGARLSRRGRAECTLGWTLLVSAAFTVGLPSLAPRVAGGFAPRGLALDEIAPLMAWGSLASALLLFLPAALCLGCVGPLAVESLAAGRGVRAGEAGGRVLCASTLGSLAGTFGTTHLLIPELGLTRTFTLAAGLLSLAGLALLLGAGSSARTRQAAALAALLLTAAALLSRFQGPAPGDDWTLLEQRESPYQSIRVLERGEGEDKLRFLSVNESLDSFQSVWTPRRGPLPTWGYYYNLFALPAAWAEPARTWNLLTLGLGAGTTVRVLDGVLPASVELVSTGVEIDPIVVELATAYFELERDDRTRRVITDVDARSVVRASSGVYDQIVVDAFANNMEVPAHLATVEFFTEVRAALAPKGWLTVNAAGFGLEDPVVRTLAGTLASAWREPVLVLRVPFSRNCVLIARKDAPLVRPGESNWRVPDHALTELLELLEVPGASRLVDPARDGEALTDDRNAIERLQVESIRTGRRAWLERS